ncbi:RraA family protein [Paracoccus ravus]|uniref:RraA family protein n=1 Tax=Paracoccus ravus TaxID=2447760 RepID=UPI00106EC60A|nr:RraA family protein [Paracoccus ravus]
MTPYARLAELGAATLGEAWPQARIATAPPRPLAPDMALAGPAVTVRCQPGDNLALHRVIAQAGPGDVLVVDYGGRTDSAPFGEIMALACQLRGIAGLIIDGAVRDSMAIIRAGFPVFAHGLTIFGSTKRHAGAIGANLLLAGTEVASGDLVVADADGMVVVARDQIDKALEAAQARAAREEHVMARLRAGESTLEIFGLGPKEDE